MTQQQQNTQALAKVSAAQTVLDEAQIDPRLIMAAKAIQLMAGQDDNGKPKISADMALAAAMYQAGTGQLLGRDFYVNEKIGRMEGYRGVSRDAMDRGVGEVQIKYRPLTSQECEDHEIQAGDTAVVCEVYQLRAWQLAQKMGQPYEPITGVGVVRKVEKYTAHEWKESGNGKKYKVALPEKDWKPLTLEGGMTWRKKAQNRAYKEALRHVPGANASAAEVLEEATLAGMTHQPPEAVRMSVEQAIEWARQNAPQDDIQEGEFTAEEAAATLAANNVRTRGTGPEWKGFGDDERPVSEEQAQADAEFNAMPSASAGTSSNNGKTTPPAKHDAGRPWDDERKAEAVRWAMRTYPGIFKAPQHAMHSLDNCLEAGAAQGLSAAELAQAWKEKCYAKFLELDTTATEPEPPSHADLDAQAAAETPHF